ncbi:helix-turn-helix domain-containing protein [Vibrio fluvialis]|uniref:winged helix-turn-helix domain-containing protein n=1 Tax=Vibrio fluvialis TaxID=676 RepID=UPI001F3C5891|nr:helix-turn-helix domain-containing protein [Vibrio fluvialis]MCE7635814.1 helix-turn-helix domain-containing protein [Vibrio fluvialis]
MTSNYIYIDFSEEGGSYFIAVDKVRYKCSYAESAILAHLLNHKGEYYSKENLASIGWPGKLVSKNSVPVSIANLRKILKNHTQLDIIINEKNKGYVVVDPKILLSEAEAEAEAEAESMAEAAQVINKKSPFPSVRLQQLTSQFIGYPLLVVNLILLVLFVLQSNNHIETSPVNIVQTNSYIAVLPNNDTTLFSKLVSNQQGSDTKEIAFSSLDKMIKQALQQNKHVLFINSIGNRAVIDCLRQESLVSYSGNDLDEIVQELKIHGCNL